MEKMTQIKIRDKIDEMETKEVLIMTDIKGKQYMFNGTNLFRLKKLKGIFGKPLTQNK